MHAERKPEVLAVPHLHCWTQATSLQLRAGRRELSMVIAGLLSSSIIRQVKVNLHACSPLDEVVHAQRAASSQLPPSPQAKL